VLIETSKVLADRMQEREPIKIRSRRADSGYTFKGGFSGQGINLKPLVIETSKVAKTPEKPRENSKRRVIRVYSLFNNE
jgi:hypothetical protein